MASNAPFRVEFTESAATFANTSRSYLSANAISTNIISTVCAQIISGALDPVPALTLFASVLDRESSETVGAFALMGRPFGVLCTMPAGAATAVAESLYHRNDFNPSTLQGVDGNTPACQEFCRRWSELTGRSFKVVHEDSTLALDRAAFDEACSKQRKWSGRCAESWSDVDLLEVVAGWMDPYHIEAMPDHKTQPINRKFLLDAIQTRRITVWLADDEDTFERLGTPVSFCNWRPSLDAGGVARLGPVYTPPEYRGKGYASACVAEGTKRAFELGGAGKVMLFVANYNPVGRHVYEKLGYQEVDRGVWMRFEE